MWLERVLLENPQLPGAFCVSTSYRNEPNPVEGRHDKIFPMFEFEIHGGQEALVQFEKELLEHLGFPKVGADGDYPRVDYEQVAKDYGVRELGHEHEERLEKDYGPAVFLENFPFYTSPFWNMKADMKSGRSNKVDVIIHGIETIGSAERSCNTKEMKEMFENISDGLYAKTLYNKFTKERVEKELDDFLSYNFFPRSGGGIGVTRMIRAMKLSGLLSSSTERSVESAETSATVEQSA
jgi:aspartyl/asparaginyl-tRNA synthetase